MSINLIQKLWQVLIIILLILVIILNVNGENISGSLSAGSLIYDGSLPSGEGSVPIKAVSGKLYQVPVMSPLGINKQSLAGTDIINSYTVGDELISKRGILTLDAINGVIDTGDNTWSVYVNDHLLNDYLLPTKEALNIIKLKTGDVIIFSYGNPVTNGNNSLKSVRVTIGSQLPIAIPNPVQESNVSQINQNSSQNTISSLNESIKSVVSIEPTPIPTLKEEIPSTLGPKESNNSSSQIKTDPNLPVYEDQEKVTSEKTVKSTTEKDPNLPVYEDQEKSNN